MKLLPVALVLCSLPAVADTATQSDWSGGPGAPGPVGAWASSFSDDFGCDWFSAGGSVGIAAGIEYEIPASSRGSFGVSGADIDGDGDGDIVSVSGVDVVWWENLDGPGTIWAEHEIDGEYTGAYGLCADDLDGDGDVDVIDSSPTELMWWENADGLGTAWVRHTIDPGIGGIASLCTDDMNADGHPDILCAAIASNTICWWQNVEGTGLVWSKRMVDGDFACARGVFTDDMDLDGDRDVIGAGQGCDTVSWWENIDGYGAVWAEHVVDGNISTPWSASSADLDSDGDRDVFAAAFNGSAIVSWENLDGSGDSWAKSVVEEGIWGPCSVYPGDPDGDGDEDILGAAYYQSIISWWQFTGGAWTSWTEHVLDANFDGAFDIDSGDINGDGTADIAAAAAYDALAWWDMTAFPGQGSLVSSILYTGCDPDWESLSWTADTPAGTSLAFQIRASDDSYQMGAWSDTIASPCALHGILADNDSYLQYKVILTTTDPGATPVLLDVTVAWDPLGIGGGGQPGSVCLLPVTPDPATGPVRVSFGIPEALDVDLLVFDVSGRLVESTGSTAFAPGWHTIELEVPGPGIYLVRLRAGGMSADGRFAVVR